METEDAADQQQLPERIDALLDPVHGGGAAIPGGEIAHSHIAEKAENEHGDQALFLHLHGQHAETRADCAEAEHHHADKDEGTGKERGSDGQVCLFALGQQQHDKQAAKVAGKKPQSRMSLCFTITYFSSSSNLTSVPEYLE